MGLPVIFHRLERLIAGDDVYRLGAWKTLKCDSGVLDASQVATWDCDGFFFRRTLWLYVFFSFK